MQCGVRFSGAGLYEQKIVDSDMCEVLWSDSCNVHIHVTWCRLQQTRIDALSKENQLQCDPKVTHLSIMLRRIGFSCTGWSQKNWLGNDCATMLGTVLAACSTESSYSRPVRQMTTWRDVSQVRSLMRTISSFIGSHQICSRIGPCNRVWLGFGMTWLWHDTSCIWCYCHVIVCHFFFLRQHLHLGWQVLLVMPDLQSPWQKLLFHQRNVVCHHGRTLLGNSRASSYFRQMLEQGSWLLRALDSELSLGMSCNLEAGATTGLGGQEERRPCLGKQRPLARASFLDTLLCRTAKQYRQPRHATRENVALSICQGGVSAEQCWLALAQTIL